MKTGVSRCGAGGRVVSRPKSLNVGLAAFAKRVRRVGERVVALRLRVAAGDRSAARDALEELHASYETLRKVETHLHEQRDELRQLAALLEEQSARYVDLFEGTSEIHVITDRSAVIVEANAAASAFFDVAGGDLVGKRLVAFVAPGDAWRVRAAVQALQLRPEARDDTRALDLHVRCLRREVRDRSP